ncbi:hypothetical protein ACFSC3_14285 [Sphingomonas floccifaciens]|uniref:Uncharacterized protein n=1 Tax=Sphingomonas floccifaciens TaxID=1844115 RepID=A0ABW4NFB3_9SPHN
MIDHRHQPEEQAGQAVAEEGIVVLDGPGSVAVSMTPHAAEGTAESLSDAAREARRQAAEAE